MSDEEDFKSLVGDDVQPLKQEKRVVISAEKEDQKTLEERRKRAQDEELKQADPLGGEPAEMVQPLDIVSYKRPGVQNGVFKNLRLGKYAVDARLDLHKMSVEVARKEIYQFVQDCVNHDVRSALITHGKGEGREQPAVLKSYVAFWLPQMEPVLAFHTATKQHGSYGATYVLLKKSEKKKLETREKMGKKLKG